MPLPLIPAEPAEEEYLAARRVVLRLLHDAADCRDATDAQKYAQAALSSAHALQVLSQLR